MSPLQPILFIAGLGVLVAGAYALIEGGVKVAQILGIPSVVIGLTVVAFGTSAPEFFVSLMGALRGSTGLVLGNVMGSNVANLGLILAVAGLLKPVEIERKMRRREIPLMFLVTGVFAAMILDGVLGRGDSLGLTLMFAGFMALSLGSRRGDNRPGLTRTGNPGAGVEGRGRALLQGGGLTLVGILGLALGGRLITDAAVAMAHALGVSEAVIGLTMVAIGTSLPELATTIMAAVKGEGDLAIGNIFGSNIFNLLGVAGPVGLLHPLQADAVPMNPGSGPVLMSYQVQILGLMTMTIVGAVLAMVVPGRFGRLPGSILLALYILITAIWLS